jgi:hypothetical protein
MTAYTPSKTRILRECKKLWAENQTIPWSEVPQSTRDRVRKTAIRHLVEVEQARRGGRK